jgi:hypothetical protein
MTNRKAVPAVGEASSPDAPLPSLILQPGETRTLPCQRWLFQDVVVPAGARLAVEPSSGEPFQLIVQGEMRLQGSIVAREWLSDETTYTLYPPVGDPIEIAFRNLNRGGDGANGTDAGGRGGQGARGTADYGGGGGGGAANATYHGGPGRVDGGDADGDRGGRAGAAHCGAAGAAGARRAPYANGGVIYLEVAGPFDGQGGEIDVRGERGAAGGAGRSGGRATTACFPGSGGAGGGAPGGQGGAVVAWLRGPVAAYPQVLTTGGDGGAAGAPIGASAGAGQRGRSGSVRWLAPPQP